LVLVDLVELDHQQPQMAVILHSAPSLQLVGVAVEMVQPLEQMVVRVVVVEHYLAALGGAEILQQFHHLKVTTVVLAHLIRLMVGVVAAVQLQSDKMLLETEETVVQAHHLVFLVYLQLMLVAAVAQ
jgi:hypothetical protein